MKKVLKWTAALIGVVVLFEFGNRIAYTYSYVFAKPIANLQCIYTRMNEEGTRIYGDVMGEIYTAQLVDDWIRGMIIYRRIGTQNEDGFHLKLEMQKLINSYEGRWLERSSEIFGDITTVIDRESLTTRDTIDYWLAAKKDLWMEADCAIIDEQVFVDEHQKAIAKIKQKQKI